MKEIEREIELYPRILFDWKGNGKASFWLRLSDGVKRGRPFQVESFLGLFRSFDEKRELEGGGVSLRLERELLTGQSKKYLSFLEESRGSFGKDVFDRLFEAAGDEAIVCHPHKGRDMEYRFTGQPLFLTVTPKLFDKIEKAGGGLFSDIRFRQTVWGYFLDSDGVVPGITDFFVFRNQKIYRLKKRDFSGVPYWSFNDNITEYWRSDPDKRDLSLQYFVLNDPLKMNKEEDYGLREIEIKADLDGENRVSIEGSCDYGEIRYSLFETKALKERDFKKEQAVRDVIDKYTTAYDREKDRQLIEGEEEIYRFLKKGLASLQEKASVFLSDRIASMRPSPGTFSISRNGNDLTLSLKGGNLSPEELSEILAKYDPKKRFVKLKNGRLLEYTQEIESIRELFSELDLSPKDMKEGEVRVPHYRAAGLSEWLKENNKFPESYDSGFSSVVDSLRRMKEGSERKLLLDDVLKDFQKRGVEWLLDLKENELFGLLSDDMGLGKTLQVIAFLSELSVKKEEKKTIIICPASLLYQWQSEFLSFAPSLSPIIIDGSREERKADISGLSEGSIIITSYQLLLRDIDLYREMGFSNIILDEAQSIKNPFAKVTKAVKELSGDFRLALTGTPVENNLTELWSIFDFLMPGFLYGRKKFETALAIPIEKKKDEVALKRLRLMTSPFIMRRKKDEVMLSLPKKTERKFVCDMTEEQRRVYDSRIAVIKGLSAEGREDGRTNKIAILAEITKAREACCDPSLLFMNYEGGSGKLSACIDLIKRAIEGEHRVLLFSQFTAMLDIIEHRLSEEKISCFRIDGSVSKKKRSELVSDFQNGNIPVFLISLKAGGEGLNLTAADVVIHYDPWWNEAAKEQASDRAYRIGQERPVTVYQMITRDTIEENVALMQQKKAALSKAALEGAGSVVTEDDLESLLNIINEDDRLKEILDECRRDLDLLGVRYHRATITTNRFHDRFKNALGVHTGRRSGSDYESVIEIGQDIMGSRKDALRDIVMHELLHDCVGCENCGHGGKWKELMKLVNSSFSGKYHVHVTEDESRFKA